VIDRPRTFNRAQTDAAAEVSLIKAGETAILVLTGGSPFTAGLEWVTGNAN